MTMAKNSNYTISEKAQSIIKAINPQNVAGQYNWIISSLYALKEGADAEIIRTLNVDVERFSSSVSLEDISTLQAEYANVVRFCYDKAKAGELKIYNDGLPMEIPSDVVEFCKKAIDPKAQDHTFIPFAGRCEFALAFDGKSSGFEISRRALAFDRILLEAFGSDMELEQTDVLCPDPDSSKQYDHIVSVPPFMKGKEEKSIVAYFLSLLESNLKEGGDMCVILPLSATYSIAWKPFREYLLSNSGSYLSAIISLPAIFMPETNVKCCMFLIEKNVNPNKNVYFFEADGPDFQYSTERDALRLSLRTETMLETFKIQDERFVKVVSADSVVSKGKDCLLRPSLFFIEKVLPSLKPGEHYVELRDLVSMVVLDMDYSTLFSEDPRGTEKYIRFSSLYDNYLACRIDLSKIPEAPARTKSIVTEEAGYYVSYLNGVVRVGYIPTRVSEKKLTEKEAWHEALWGDETRTVYLVGIDENVFHFKIKKDGEALPDYILRELLSDYVAAQAKRLSHGLVRSVLSANDFLQLIIVVPPFDEQEKILEQDRVAAFQDANLKVDELNEKFRKDVHLMKHGMGQTVFNLGNWMKMLKYARKAGNGIVDDNAEIGGLVKVKVADIYDNIEASLKVLNRQLTTFAMGDSMKKTKMSLTDFIDKYIAEHPRPHVRYDFPSQQHRSESDVPMVKVDNSDPKNPKVMEYPSEYVVRKGDATDFIVFSEEALTIIFENIVSNAVAHGFSDPEKEYLIHIDFVPYGTSYVLTISNNGDPLPAGKDPSEVFIWGKTNGGKEHAGIGGYQVKDLMEHFEGKAEIISTPGQEFTVTYKLTFTKTNLLDANL